MNKVSIIIPAYNAEKYIERCIISCVTQDYVDLEVIIVDDGSKDATLQICEKYAKKFDKLIVFSKENSGVSKTRNYGIEKSTGDYILFVDADDYLEKDMCSKLVQHMNSEIDLVVCGYYIEEKGTRKVCCLKDDKQYTKKEFAAALSDMQQENLLYVCWNKIFKREKINIMFPEDMTFGEDSVFNFGYLEKCNSIKNIAYVGYHYNVENNYSAMHRYHSGMLEMIMKEFSAISHCLFVMGESLLFAQAHLIDNIFIFFLPNLFHTASIEKKEKKNIFKEISSTLQVKDALKVYKYGRRRQKILALAIRYNWYFVAALLYR